MWGAISPGECSALYRLVATSPTDLVIKTDRRGLIVHATPASAGLGMAFAGDPVGRHLLELIHHSYADLVLAVYNPASRSRTKQVARAQEVLLEHRKRETVVVVGRDVGRAEESLQVTSLGELDPSTIDMKCLLIVGAESTRVSPAGVWTPRFVR